MKNQIKLLEFEFETKTANLEVKLKEVDEERLTLKSEIENVEKKRMNDIENIEKLTKSLDESQRSYLDLQKLIDDERHKSKVEYASLKQELLMTQAEKESIKNRTIEETNVIENAHKKTVSELEIFHSNKIQDMSVELLKAISYKEELETKLHKKEADNLEMVNQIDELKVIYREQIHSLENQLEESKRSAHTEDNQVQDLLKKLSDYDQLRAKVKELEKAHHQEKDINKRIEEERQIIYAKLLKAREDTEENSKQFEVERKKFIAEKANCDEIIKDTRLEMEGKLEKMKDRMVRIAFLPLCMFDI